MHRRLSLRRDQAARSSVLMLPAARKGFGHRYPRAVPDTGAFMDAMRRVMNGRASPTSYPIMTTRFPTSAISAAICDRAVYRHRRNDGLVAIILVCILLTWLVFLLAERVDGTSAIPPLDPDAAARRHSGGAGSAVRG